MDMEVGEEGDYRPNATLSTETKRLIRDGENGGGGGGGMGMGYGGWGRGRLYT